MKQMMTYCIIALITWNVAAQEAPQLPPQDEAPCNCKECQEKATKVTPPKASKIMRETDTARAAIINYMAAYELVNLSYKLRKMDNVNAQRGNVPESIVARCPVGFQECQKQLFDYQNDTMRAALNAPKIEVVGKKLDEITQSHNVNNATFTQISQVLQRHLAIYVAELIEQKKSDAEASQLLGKKIESMIQDIANGETEIRVNKDNNRALIHFPLPSPAQK